MTDLQKFVLAKLLPSKIELEQGQHPFDFVAVVAAKGVVSKGKSSMATPTVNIPMIPLLALMFKRMGIQRDAMAKLLRECMTEAIEEGKKGADVLKEQYPEIHEWELMVNEVTQSLPKVPKTGPTSVAGAIEICEFPRNPIVFRPQ